MGTPEGKIVKDILEYLELPHLGVFAWRNSTGAGYLNDGHNKRSRFVRFGKVGSSDILGVFNDGRMLAIECKTEKGEATYEQLKFLAEVTKRHGIAFIARSVDDVIDHFKRYRGE